MRKKVQPRKIPALVKWLRGAGIAAFVLGASGMVVDPGFFLLSTLLVLAAPLMLALDSWFEPDLSRFTKSLGVSQKRPLRVTSKPATLGG